MQRRATTDIEIIHEAIIDAQQFTAGKSFDEYLGDDLTRFATERVLEKIGSAIRRMQVRKNAAVARLSQAEKFVHLSNVLLYEYDAVPHRDVWSTIQQDLSKLLADVDALAKNQ
jgi:uncharacterized protein with HEPN domain